MLEPHIQWQINITWKYFQEIEKNQKDPNSADDKKEKRFSKQYTTKDSIQANQFTTEVDTTTYLFNVDEDNDGYYKDNDNNDLDISMSTMKPTYMMD